MEELFDRLSRSPVIFFLRKDVQRVYLLAVAKWLSRQSSKLNTFTGERDGLVTPWGNRYAAIWSWDERSLMLPELEQLKLQIQKAVVLTGVPVT